MPLDLAAYPARIRTAIATGSPSAACEAFELAIAAAAGAGRQAIAIDPCRPAAELLALALQAADEVIEALAVELATGEDQGGTGDDQGPGEAEESTS